MNIRTAAHLLGGTVCGHNRILCPGPGHTRRDRSLSVAFVGADEPIVEGREVALVEPEVGTDLNDELMMQGSR